MRERVFAIISRELNVPLDEVDETSSPHTIPTWDSLTQLKLVLALEEEFGVHFEDDLIVELVSVREILRNLQELLPGEPPA